MGSRQFSSNYIPALDGIRGIAILLVMLFHVGNPIFKGGFIGVDVFFVLSGFLITSLLLNEYDKNFNINLKYFYARRILRLAPALLVLLITITLISIFILEYNQTKDNLYSVLITLFYSANWVRAFNLYDLGYLNHTWSLSIEEQFYIIWPFLLITLLRIIKSRKHVLNIVIFLSVASWILRIILQFKGYDADRLYNGLDTRADALLTGCVLSLILSSNLIDFRREKVSSCIKYLGMSAIISYILILLNISWSSKLYFYFLAFLIQILTAFLILHILLPGDNYLKKVLTNKPLVWIGSISYGLYLWHDPVYEMIRMQGYSLWTIALLGITITFAIASLSFYFIEKPILKLKSKFTTTLPKTINVLVKENVITLNDVEHNTNK